MQVAEAAVTPENVLHVIARSGKWVVKKEGAKRAIGIYASKTKAIEIATERVKSGSTEAAIIHDLFGQPSQKIV